MTWLDQLLQYSRENLWELATDSIFNGADSIEDVDKTLYSYGSFKVLVASGYAREKLGEDIEIDPRVRLDHGSHKDFMIDYVGTYQMGGRNYEVVIDTDDCYLGKICDGPLEFENEFVAGVRSLLKNYFHVQNHVKENLDEKAYNPAKDFRPEPKPLDKYLG
jgi:hypothetical protein